MEPVGFDQHDHHRCISTGVQTADAACRARGLRLTPVRRRVLEILLSEHRAMGAYDILEVLRAEGLGSQPPVAYRALGFLVDQGFAHKVERLNAFIACGHACGPHTPIFMICESCGTVAETTVPEVDAALAQAGAGMGFRIGSTTIETLGTCSSCEAEAAA